MTCPTEKKANTISTVLKPDGKPIRLLKSLLSSSRYIPQLWKKYQKALITPCAGCGISLQIMTAVKPGKNPGPASPVNLLLEPPQKQIWIIQQPPRHCFMFAASPESIIPTFLQSPVPHWMKALPLHPTVNASSTWFLTCCGMRTTGIGSTQVERIILTRKTNPCKVTTDLRRSEVYSSQALTYILLNGRRPAKQISLFYPSDLPADQAGSRNFCTSSL